MRYKNRLGVKIAQIQAQEAEQRHLRKKYKVLEDGVIEVKKKRLLEIVLGAGAGIVRTVVRIILLVLATVGLIALLYVGPRNELELIFRECVEQLEVMLP